MVFGGQYRRGIKKDISAVGNGVPVEVIDIFERGRPISSLAKGDMVVWVTTSNDHSTYHKVKGHCKKNDIDFYHLNRGGNNALIELIKQIAPSR